MALFTDGGISTIADLLAYESEILDVAATEGIDLTIKLGLAKQELGIELQAFLAGRQQFTPTLFVEDVPFALHKILITDPLHKWHTFQALALVYRDAYHRQLNDRYQGKWQEYESLAGWAKDMLFQGGVAVTEDPVSKADKPDLSTVPGSLAAATYFVQVSWRNSAGDEGSPSEIAVLSTTDGTLLVVTPLHQPANVASWNVYAGFSGTDLTLQNDAPLAVGQPWTEPASGLKQGRRKGAAQAPQYYIKTGRTLQRG